MRELNLQPYLISIANRNETTGQLEMTQGPYDVRGSLIGLLFTRDLQLNSRDLLERDPLGRKIADAVTDTILLEDREYEILRKAVDAFKGYTRNEIELVKRVLEAKTVEVEKKLPKGEPIDLPEGAVQ